MDTFELIAAQRREIADMLAGLTDEQWQVQSLCDAWTVHGVASHLLMPLVVPGPKFIVAMVASLGDFNKANVKLTAEVGHRSNAHIIAGLREHAGSRFTPPGSGPAAPLTDTLVHGQDIRRPLGIPHAFCEEEQLAALGYLTGGKARGVVPKSRIEGLSFTATDLDWSAGAGALVTGSAEAIMMAVAGRAAALDDLSGPGIEALRSRVAGG